MADVFTGSATGFVNNYPETTTATLSDIRMEQMRQASDILDSVRDNKSSTIDATQNQTANLMDRFFHIGRDVIDNRVQITSLGFQLRDGFAAAAKDAEINALKTQVEMQKQSTLLSNQITAEGDRTRALINDLKYQDLNRDLIERNSILTEERWGRRYWRDFAGQSQYAALNSQLQAFGSQLNDTRNGMVNFGTQLGVRQAATSNNA